MSTVRRLNRTRSSFDLTRPRTAPRLCARTWHSSPPWLIRKRTRLDLSVANDRGASYVLYDMSTRIDARLDDELVARLDEIRRQTGKPLTEIIETALREWTEKFARRTPTPAEAFEGAGFIGSGEGDRHLAADAKTLSTTA